MRTDLCGVVYLVAKLLNQTQAGVDLVMIQSKIPNYLLPFYLARPSSAAVRGLVNNNAKRLITIIYSV